MADYISNYSGPEVDQAIASVSNHSTRLTTAELNIASLQNVSSTTVVQTGLTAEFRKCGRIVQMSIIAGTTSKDTASGEIIINVPVGYRPILQVEMWNTWGGQRIVCWANSGVAFTAAATAGTYVRCTGTWISAS